MIRFTKASFNFLNHPAALFFIFKPVMFAPGLLLHQQAKPELNFPLHGDIGSGFFLLFINAP
ncbi:hypothetical protein CWS43_10190 [Rahnella sp. AA]|nr:hypothetical protein CWS43_10190 [Rahnella sp. AA]